MKQFISTSCALAFALIWSPIVLTQMTDTQIIEYVKTQSALGMNEKQIARDLPVNQLQNLCNRYEQQEDQSKTMSADTTSRQRVNNGQTRTILVHVMGEVKTPGSYMVSTFANAFNALYLSGGMTDIGTMRDVQVSRDGKVIAHYDVYDFIMNGQIKGDMVSVTNQKMSL